MLIGIDASRANELPRTGTEWYSYHIIQQFKKLISKEHEVILYLAQAPLADLLPLPENFHFRVLKWPSNFLWTQMRLSWEMLVKPPDVLFIPSHTMPLFHPPKTFVTLHDIGFERFSRLYSKTPIGPQKGIGKLLFSLGTRVITLGKYQNTELDYHRWSTRFALKNSAKIFTISRFSKAEILNVFGQKYQNKIEVVPISFDRELFCQKFSEEEVSHTLTKFKIKRPYIYFIGRLEEKKNIKGLIEIFNILRKKYQPHLELVLVGNPGYGYSDIEQKISHYQLDQHIVHPAGPTERERAILMQSAAVFVFPSFYEGFGIPPLEAMAAGTPVVAANSAAISEVCGEAAILVDPHRFGEFAEKIHLVLTNQEWHQKLVDRGQKQIQNFSWEKCARQILAAILKISK